MNLAEQRIPSVSIKPQRRSVVEVTNLTKHYGDFVALNTVNLSVLPGEVLGILGPNGAGKTTLLEILEGLKQPTYGEAMVLGMRPDVRTVELKAQTAVVMQHNALSPLLTVRETVRLYATIYRKNIDIKEFLDKTGLVDKQHSRVRHLSGGQKQRLTIALALLSDAQLMFLDEPTSELDPQARRMVWELLQQRCREHGTALVLTTHQMEEAAALCDRIIILDQGQILAEGSPAELVQTYCPGQRISFSCQNRSQIRDLTKLSFPITTHDRNNQVDVVIQCQDLQQTLQELLNLAQKTSLVIPDLRVTSNTLEDVFLHLTGRQLRD
jgi:ABC-2 type transport system ATP-binding protein